MVSINIKYLLCQLLVFLFSIKSQKYHRNVFGYKCRAPIAIGNRSHYARLYTEIPNESDAEIARKLEEFHRQKVKEYMDPMTAGKIPKMSQDEIAENFGVPSTPENLERRQREAEILAEAEPPDVPPTNKLPYFVNLERPDKPLGDLEFVPQEQEQSAEPEEPVKQPYRNYANRVTYDAEGTVITEVKGDDTEVINASHGEIERKTRVIPQGSKSAYAEEEYTDDYPVPVSTNVTDPLIQLMEAPDSDEEDEEEEKKDPTSGGSPTKLPKWYHKREIKGLSQVDLEDGWSILPCGKIYKHLLRPTIFEESEAKRPKQTSCVTFAFKFMNALTGEVFLESKDLDGDMLVSYMEELEESQQRCLASMEAGEQAEFILHISEADLGESECEELENVEWLRYWIYLWEVHENNERWWGLGPDDASLYPPADEDNSKLTKMEKLDIKTEEIKKNIELELSTNPASPLWEDVLPQMSASQKESVVQHFDRQLESTRKMKHMEYTGSRGFAENLVDSGQRAGYDLGQVAGGISQFIVWRETPFMMYIAVAVVPGVRAQHVQFNMTHNHLQLKVGNKMVIDDDFTGYVETDSATSWAVSEAATKYDPLPMNDAALKDPVIKLSHQDEYEKVAKTPSILVALKKQSKHVMVWGAPFVNI